MQYRSLCLTCLSNPRQGPACWGLPFSRSEIWGGALARCEPSSVRGDGDAHALVAEAHSGRAAAARLDVGDELVELGALHQRENVGERVKLELGAHAAPSSSPSFAFSHAEGTRFSRPSWIVLMSPPPRDSFSLLRGCGRIGGTAFSFGGLWISSTEVSPMWGRL